jgi:hypothetical protein
VNVSVCVASNAMFDPTSPSGSAVFDRLTAVGTLEDKRLWQTKERTYALDSNVAMLAANPSPS